MSQQRTAEAMLGFDTTDAAFVRDPYPRYDELRESDELHRTRDGLWILTRHADVLAALRDPRLSSSPRHVPAERRPESGGNLLLLADDTISLMLTADAPDHTRLRRLAN
ncbi:MAG: cytochrome P450, partial [Actinomycetota bacterium]|nr:cytochrome P450 [Actinomycetota bacterium]